MLLPPAAASDALVSWSRDCSSSICPPESTYKIYNIYIYIYNLIKFICYCPPAAATAAARSAAAAQQPARVGLVSMIDAEGSSLASGPSPCYNRNFVPLALALVQEKAKPPNSPRHSAPTRPSRSGV